MRCNTVKFLTFWQYSRSLVSFGQKARAIGENAKTQEISNYKNTVGSLKRLIGRQFSDPDVQEVEKKFVTAELVDAKGTVGLKVSFRSLG